MAKERANIVESGVDWFITPSPEIEPIFYNLNWPYFTTIKEKKMKYLRNQNFKVKKVTVNSYDFIRIIPGVNYVELTKYDIPRVTYCVNNDYWVAQKDCKITIEFADGDIIEYTVNEGFVTDFASVPKSFRNIISNDSVKIIIPAIIHDINFGAHYFGFKDSNVLLKEMCKFYGMGFFKRNAIYYSVKLFARSHYDIKHKEIRENKEFFNLEVIYEVEG